MLIYTDKFSTVKNGWNLFSFHYSVQFLFYLFKSFIFILHFIITSFYLQNTSIQFESSRKMLNYFQKKPCIIFNIMPNSFHLK